MASHGSGFFGRLENKVFLIIILTTLASTFAVFSVTRSMFYSAMMDDVRERTKIVNKYLQGVVDPDSFVELNQKDDDTTAVYARQQGVLNRIRQVANVRYLFTAKYDSAGQIIYVTDGLELGSQDFRFIGDKVEDEILSTVDRCLKGNIVESGDIMRTEWGAIFLTCWPIRRADNAVTGAMVMEFDAEKLYKSANHSTLLSVGISIAIGFVFILLARIMLSRVSEPFYKRLAYMDYLTGLNNRMAFEQSLQALHAKPEVLPQVSLIMYDLNNLKKINDQMGHEAGDRYIRKMADMVSGFFQDNATSYRIGGDEFVTVVIGGDVAKLEEELRTHFLESYCVDNLEDYFAFSFGIATFTPGCDNTLHDVLHRADRNMYVFKAYSKSLAPEQRSRSEIAI